MGAWRAFAGKQAGGAVEYVQSLAVLVILLYAMYSFGMAAFAHRRGEPFVLQEAGTPLLRSFGDWAPRSLRLLMLLRRVALAAALVLGASMVYALFI
ncbi:hypothetical protein [Robbsia andropogonis]|nr:hypothetical protein [Robbsia andropogonis]MCP1117921.1 hypothetical protein [Robbsia andropogonis]MCP1127386.1 hypothetical protein [Robbsia andropogonis]